MRREWGIRTPLVLCLRWGTEARVLVSKTEMTKVTDALEAAGDRPVVLCDFSPPRSGNPTALEDVSGLATDFFCVAYNPGKAVRASSSSVAYRLMQTTGK